MLYSLQYLRFVAALYVALFHFREIFGQYGGGQKLVNVFSFGYVGVDIFFVMAGFIMVFITGFRGSAMQFATNRLTRIYSGYWPVFLFFLAYKWVFSDINRYIPNGLSMLDSAFLTSYDSRVLLIYPTWSLMYEIFFYLMFAILLALRYVTPAFLMGIGLLLMEAHFQVLDPFWHWFLLNPIQIEFALGILLGVVYRNQDISTRIFRISICMTIFLYAVGVYIGIENGFREMAIWDRVMFFGGGSFFLIYTLLYLEQHGAMPFSRQLKVLGDASYAMYLIHAPLFYILEDNKVLYGVGTKAGPYTLLLLVFTVLCILAVAYHLLIELPLYRLGKQKISNWIPLSASSSRVGWSD